MNVERLQHLANIMERVPEEKLVMKSWQSFCFAGMNVLENYRAKLHECGTSACAAGWAMGDPEFARQGLVPAAWGTPSHDGILGFRALMNFFGLTALQAEKLFGANNNYTPKAVAAIAREMACQKAERTQCDAAA